MRVMVLLKATTNSEAGVMPDAALMEAMGAFNAELMEAGVLVGGEGLKPSREGRRVTLADGQTEVAAGPFAIGGGLIAGFWVWQVASMEDAVAWARRCPPPMPGEVAELELRPVFEMDDFGEAMSPELRAQEEAMRAALEG